MIDGESVNFVRIVGMKRCRSRFYFLLFITSLNLGFITITIILGIALIGMRGETVVQITLLLTLTVSLIDFFVGSFIPATSYKRRHGFEGYSCKEKLFIENKVILL